MNIPVGASDLTFLVVGFYCLAIGAAASLLVARNREVAGWIAFVATAASAVLAAFDSSMVLFRGRAADVTLAAFPAWGATLRLYVDGLTALFVILIALVSVLTALYSIRYMRHYSEYGAARYYPSFLLFVAGMYGIVTITDLMFVFCAAWQLMTITSFLLVRYEHRRPASVRAAWRYLAMMEVACMLVMAGSFVLGRHVPAADAATRYDFEILAATIGIISPGSWAVSATLALFLVGFGIKAGMWPFGQLWLPDAHPAAPSPVSALLSGVMIKTGVYGLMRSFLWMIPASSLPAYASDVWGAVIAVLGALTLFVGTMQALKQEQTKRLLAFHSIGQIGYILLGLGACLALIAPGSTDERMAVLALVAFFGALYHTLNHAMFKSLLFLNAGSMIYATNTQDLNRLGGLMRYMPLTAVTALVASFSIAGVPGFNGFASKWSIYVATILGSPRASYLPFLGLVAILTSALTLASFLKFFGMAFLSRKSALVADKARTATLEPPVTMRAPQAALALLCVVFGLAPAWIFKLMANALRASEHGLGERLSMPPSTGALLGVDVLGSATLNPFAFALVLGGLLWVARFVSLLGRSERRSGATWLCGYVSEAESNRYRAHGLYGEIKRYFGWLGGGQLRKTDGSDGFVGRVG
jgi:hydrogenase-4 component B